MSRAVLPCWPACAALLVSYALSPLSARAQSCHAPPLRDMAGASMRSEAHAFVAGYDQDGVRGSYQGGSLSLGFVHRSIELDAALAYYHLERAGSSEHGLGDVLAGVHVPVLRLGEAERFVFGPELSATLPSGDSSAGLGMGHVMLMPGLFARLWLSRFVLVAQLAYGIALTHGQHAHAAASADPHAAHHHHDTEVAVAAHEAGPAPIVNPMNRSELEHALSAAFQWTDWFALTARVAGAVPIADEAGELRETLAFGPRFTVGPVDVGAEQELPLAGDPFRYRTVLRIGAQF